MNCLKQKMASDYLRLERSGLTGVLNTSKLGKILF